MPIDPVRRFTKPFPGVFLNLFGISSLSPANLELWRAATVKYMEDFLDKQFTDEQILTAEIRISEVQSNSEGDMVMNVFNLFINYTARIDSDVLPEDLVAAPFFKKLWND